MDPQVLQAAERVLAFARAQVIAAVNARLVEDSELSSVEGDDDAAAEDDASGTDASFEH